MSPSQDYPRISAELVRRVLDFACAAQQIPSPTFAEGKRATWMRDQFVAFGFSKVEIDPTGNVYACIPGAQSQRPIVASAHLDTVFPIDTDLHLSRSSDHIAGPGIGDNCLGLAGLLGLGLLVRERHALLSGDVWLVANVGEEGLGDLIGMRAVADRFKDTPVAYLVVEGMGLGEIFHQGLGVQRYRITIRTPGGHSWIDYGRPSAIHELAGLITRITAIPVSQEPRSSLNVGIVQGGTSINTIASQASLELDLRSASGDCLAELIKSVLRLVKETNRPGIRCHAEIIGQRPSGFLSLEHPLIQVADRCLRDLGVNPMPGIGSTDANIPLSRGYPSICIGLTTGAGAHTLDEFIRIPPLAKGLEQLFQIVARSWDASQ